MAYLIFLDIHSNSNGEGEIIIARPERGVKPVVWDQEILQELISLAAYASFEVRQVRDSQWLYLNYANTTEPQQTLDMTERESEREIITRATKKNIPKIVFRSCSCLVTRGAAAAPAS